jgi:hypothetical protein
VPPGPRWWLALFASVLTLAFCATDRQHGALGILDA